MITRADKKELRINYLLPKDKLRSVRLSKEITTSQMSKVIGISREQYEKKEAGKYPFQDYEMIIIADYLNMSITELFF